jgi:hypothetical protein
MNKNSFVRLQSNDEVNQDRARGLGAARGLDVQERPLEARLSSGDTLRNYHGEYESAAPR